MEARIALITGSSSGIGEATALLFAKKGYHVAVHGSSSREKVDKVVAECNKLSPNGFKALGIVHNFEDADNADVVVKKTVEHFGGLDILVNNAGRLFRPPLKEADRDSDTMYKIYKQTQTVNFDATARVTYAAIEHLKKSEKDPNIVFVSSVGATKPSSSASYSISKAAMSMLGNCMALDLAPKVRSNIISPGPVFTPIFAPVGLYNDTGREMISQTIPLQRVGDPHEIAQGIEYLTDAKFTTGTDLVIDGGYLKGDTSFSAVVWQKLREEKSK